MSNSPKPQGSSDGSRTFQAVLVIIMAVPLAIIGIKASSIWPSRMYIIWPGLFAVWYFFNILALIATNIGSILNILHRQEARDNQPVDTAA